MKKGKELRALSYVAGIFVIAAALLLVVFLLLTLAGLIHPRQQPLTLYTPDIIKEYDGLSVIGGQPEITHGVLHDGHTLEILNLPQHSRVGQYENAPEFRIIDETGADVTELYAIEKDYGFICIQPRSIGISCVGDCKYYDGNPLTAAPVSLTAGALAPGDYLKTEDGNSILYPGSIPVEPAYQIISKDGANVTDQYAVSEYLGDLTILPRSITLSTSSGKKVYDGTPLTTPGWKQVQGKLLDGHSIEMSVTASQTEVGSSQNEGTARILDEDGKDVSNLYNIQYQFGTLEIQSIPLYIRTGSARKVYDGTPLDCLQWELTGGDLPAGASIVPKRSTTATQVGSTANVVQLTVLDENGADITFRYRFVYEYGTLNIQPRTITIRTGSAEKPFDGTPLRCHDYELIKGTLCENEHIEITGVSITNVGYSDNYVLDCTIYRIDENGTKIDVSACYRISFELGLLRITPN